MTRGPIPEAELAAIDEALPDVHAVRDAALSFDPTMMSLIFGPKSEIPVAAVCLDDASSVAADAHYALHECIAHGRYYREFADPANEIAATWSERYYADDVAVRLYPAGEHLSSAIVFMLELDDDALDPYRNGTSSLQARIGRYVAEGPAPASIRDAIKVLHESSAWRSAIQYRNSWTHDKPPTVADLGLVYERKKRWTTTDHVHVLGVGGGDTPALTALELRETVEQALRDYLVALGGVVDCYREVVEKRKRSV